MNEHADEMNAAQQVMLIQIWLKEDRFQVEGWAKMNIAQKVSELLIKLAGLQAVVDSLQKG